MVRLGALIPATNTTVEPEMYKMAPEGVSIHFERVSISRKASSPEEVLDVLAQDTPRAARTFTAIEPKLDAIAFACNSGSFYKGPDFEKKLVRTIEVITGVPSFSASGGRNSGS